VIVETEDISYDLIYEAAGMITGEGYQVEMAIPFAILNFPEGATTFGVNFARYHYRTRETSQWADTTVRDLPEERGRLIGLSPSPTARRFPLTFMPYVLAGKDVPDRDGDVQDEMLEGGIDIRYQPRLDLTGVLSLYPDFSQVEEDVTNIAFSYNEKFVVDNRPFFQEGSAYFPSEELFYSNRVPDFDYGIKGFTRMGGNQIGALATRSQDSRIDAVFNFEREFDATHSAGLTAVGTDQDDLQNLVLSGRVDGRQESGFLYALEGGQSSTQDEKGDGQESDDRDKDNRDHEGNAFFRVTSDGGHVTGHHHGSPPRSTVLVTCHLPQVTIQFHR